MLLKRGHAAARAGQWSFNARLLAIALALLALAAPAAHAFSVQPLLVEMEPGQSGAIRIENTRAEPLTIEVSISKRSIDPNGTQTRQPADDDFIVLPPQLVIQPGRVQVVRLQWVGDQAPTQSLSYYANLREVPVALAPAQGAQLQVAFAFDVAVHVAPRGARADLALVSAELARGSGGASVARLTLENRGSKFAYLQNAAYEVEALNASGQRVAQPSFTEEQLSDLFGVTLLEPGRRRIVDLPLGSAPGAASIRARVRAGAAQ